jgi:dTDP-4-amino-4,6-dideoxygalactose transaminase
MMERMMETIPFNRPYMTGRELFFIAQAHFSSCIAGDGQFTRQCSEWIERKIGVRRALLTHSATTALELIAMLLDLREGDEIIMPSFTFVTTANAFVREKAVPVFVDVDPATLNISPAAIRAAITSRTRAIVVVHYAGVACDMDAIQGIADAHGLPVIEDAAHGILARHRDRQLGSIGALSCFSFHETKNITCGEGGALLINDPQYVERAEILREKGTNRKAFLNGQVDKYTWRDVGSSCLPSELLAAYLWAQLLEAEDITANRLSAWERYRRLFQPLEEGGLVQCPTVPAYADHNGHLFYLVLNPRFSRNRLFEDLRRVGINAISHYEPLHLSDAGVRLARSGGDLPITESIAGRLIRLPLYHGITEEQQRRVFTVMNLLLRNQSVAPQTATGGS